MRNNLFHWWWIIRGLKLTFNKWSVRFSRWNFLFLGWINKQIWFDSKNIIFIINNWLRNTLFSSPVNFSHVDYFHLCRFAFKIFITHSALFFFTFNFCTIWRWPWIKLRKLILSICFLVYIDWIIRIYVSSFFFWKSTKFIIAELLILIFVHVFENFL